MSSKASTTEDQTPAQQSEGNFDDKGRFIRVKGVRYSPSTQALIARYNDIVDNLALFGEPAVAKHLLRAADISDKPSAIQNLAEGLRKLMDDILEESQKNGNDALDALRTQLTEEFDRQRATAEQEYVDALNDKDAQIAMRDRMDTYTKDVHDTVNAFVKLFGASLGISVGVHPLGTTAIRGSILRKKFRISSFEFTLVTARPGDGILRDTLSVTTAADSDMPKLVSTQLELRSNPLAPGLSDQGRDTLDGILRKLTTNWFRETAPNLTDEELARTFRDPQAARRYFARLSADVDPSQSHEHNGEGPGGCPACNALLGVFLGEDDDRDPSFDYVASGLLGSRLFGPGHSFGSRRNHNPGPQADPYHYGNKE